jgi:hypothetical protein
MNRARRNFLLAGAGAAFVAGAALTRQSLLPHAEASARQPLWIPPLLDAREQRQSLSLNAQRGTKEFFPGRRAPRLDTAAATWVRRSPGGAATGSPDKAGEHAPEDVATRRAAMWRTYVLAGRSFTLGAQQWGS